MIMLPIIYPERGELKNIYNVGGVTEKKRLDFSVS
jgi:hypothetical protein